MNKFLIVGLSFFLLSCSNGAWENGAFNQKLIIEEDSLVMLLKDMHIIDAAAKQQVIASNVSNQVKYMQHKAVLEKHQVSKMRFDTTIHYYTQNTQMFDALYDKVINSLKEQEAALSKK